MKLTLASLCVLAALGLVLAQRPVERNKLPHKVVCYWGTWAYYRNGVDGKFEAENLNPHICTHINYGFLQLVGNKIALHDPGLDEGDEDWKSGLTWGHGMIRRMNELRKYNKNLATLASVGGWNEGSDKYSAMASTAAGRHEFVQSAVAFIREHNLDGLDLDWEYPAMKAAGEADRTPGRAADKHDYVELLKELKAAFAPHGWILSAAVSAGKPTIDRAYDIKQVSHYLDIINLMTYDFHGAWETKTAHNAPLHPKPGSTGIDHDFTVSVAVDYWLQHGADPKKLVLGIPLYGRTFRLASPSQTGIGAPAVGKGGPAGPLVKLEGMLGYNEICTMIKSGWTKHWDEQQQVPYLTNANEWIGYDDKRSIQKKLDYAKSKHLGGAMIWTTDTDDFTGHCGEGKYPLLKLISKSLNNIDGPDEHIPHTHVTAKPK